MSKKSYFELLKDPRWQKKRLEILQLANFECQNCGAKDRTLHVHHGAYIKGLKPWEYDDEMYHVLCEICHEEATTAQNALYDSLARISPCYYQHITQILDGHIDYNDPQKNYAATYAFCELLFHDERILIPITELMRSNRILKHNIGTQEEK